MEEVHGLRVAAVLAADADAELGPGRPALLDGDPDQPADAVGVDRLERGDAEDAQLQVSPEERTLDVVPRETPGHLGQVVRAEREEVGRLRDVAGGQRRPWYLDHGAQLDR